MDEKMKEMHALTKQQLEFIYGVHIDEDALFFAAEVLQVYGGESAVPDGNNTMQLVERACHMWREGLDSDSEEIILDWDEYCFDRAFLELMELKKEKSVACRSVILPLVEKELTECKNKLDCFQNKWAPAVEHLRYESEKRVNLLRYLHHELVSFINNTILEGYLDIVNLSQLLSRLSITVVNRLHLTIRSAFKERLVVGPREVAKAASSVSDLPLNYFNWPFKLRLAPRVVDLKSRLSQKLIGLDDVIHKIAHSLSKQKSTKTPFGSFLLLGPHGCGRTKLAKALAEEIFGDKDRFIKLDMSKYSEPECRSSLLYVLKRDKKPGSVVMFDNIENAHTSIYEVLSEILKEGLLTDGERTSLSFSDDLVFVSSHVGHEVFCYCRCLRDSIPKIPFREMYKDPALFHAEFSYKTCYLHQFYTKVTNQFNLEFMDLFNDVVVFPWLTPQNHMAIIRLQTRDVATFMSTSLKKPVIVYPSDAALKNVLCYQAILEKGAHAYETWHKVYMDPMLHDGALKNEADDDMIIVYIDAIVGLRNKFSFRVENSRHLQKCPIFKSSKQNFQKLRSTYRREKLQMNRIYMLHKRFFNLLELMRAKTRVDPNRILMECQDLVILIDDLLMNESCDSNELEQVQLDDFNKEIQGSLGDRTMEGDKICIKHVTGRLRSSLKEKDKATQVIIEPLLRRLSTSDDQQLNKSSLLPTSFLCLGLTAESKKQFEKCLGEHLVMDDGKKLLFQVDLSLCTEPDSFFRCAYIMDTQLLLTEAVKKSPHCVIFFHRLEMAHITVFSTILSILEDGVCTDNENNITNFGNSVVVIISDLGNKEMIGGLNGHHPESESTSNEEAAVESSPTDEMEFRGLRFELLYRLDQLLLFDPFSDEQLNQFAISPMKSLEEKSHNLYFAFLRLFDVQGKQKQHCDTDERIKYIEEALGEVVKIRKIEHEAVVARVNDPKISEDAPEIN